MTLCPANDLFSHPEAHQSDATPASPDPARPTWTNLFQEPVPSPRTSSDH
ncbi:hypothetical protein [Lentzea sp. NPDC055074]